ncbi:hypothetical protein HOE04_04165 [archaeon]|jgi:hypothetical protein|nr:hypothetical protein [archaeon]
MTYKEQTKATKDCQAGCDLFAGYVSAACIEGCKEQYKHSNQEPSTHTKQSKLLLKINLQE